MQVHYKILTISVLLLIRMNTTPSCLFLLSIMSRCKLFYGPEQIVSRLEKGCSMVLYCLFRGVIQELLRNRKMKGLPNDTFTRRKFLFCNA